MAEEMKDGEKERVFLQMVECKMILSPLLGENPEVVKEEALKSLNMLLQVIQERDELRDFITAGDKEVRH